VRRVALRGLVARRARAVLTALAVVLGVAMVSGTYVLTDTIAHAFDSIFQGSYKNTSAIISGRQVVDRSNSGNATVPASLLPRIRRVPGVESAAGAIFALHNEGDRAKLLDRHGKSISIGGAPNFAFGFDARDARFNPLKLTQGRWAGRNQVVIDKGTADAHGFHVGDRIGVAAQGPTRSFAISGIARFGSVNSLGGATIAVFDVATAQAPLPLLKSGGVLSKILLTPNRKL